MTRAWAVLAAAAAAGAVLAGCTAGSEGDSAGDATSGATTLAPAELLAQAERRLREQASFSFTTESVRTRSDRPDDPERYATAEGEVNLSHGTGNLVLRLDLGQPTDADGPYEVRWTRETFVAILGGERREATRAQARRSAGLLGRLPDEPEALVGLLRAGRAARVVGTEELDGEDVTRVAFVVGMRAAGREGVPAEVAPGAAAGMFGDELPMEAWVAPDGLPRRIAYELRQGEQRAEDGTVVLPRRTVRVTYDVDADG